jgi:DNA helicase-2/ATP-dependent DNA helicase PcrA
VTLLAGTSPDLAAKALSELFGFTFSDEQLAAVTAPLAPYVVVAGAGSGKTTVMTARVVWLVATGQVAPEQVLGLTFTTKAAGELASRVRRALARLAGTAASDGTERGEPTVATYHAFAGRLIAEHGLRLGVEPGSRLLLAGGSQQLAHHVVARTGRDLSTYDGTLDTVVGHVLALDGELAEHCLEPADVRAFDTALMAQIDALAKPMAGVVAARRCAQRRLLLSYLVDDVREARRRRDLVEFSDQMRWGAALAEQHPEVGAALREQYAVVLLDEYQDTSVSQRRLLTGLFGHGHPVTAVGDPLQAIYGWRGASVANIDDFPRHFAHADGALAPVLPLAENRRSGAMILEAANAVAEPLRALHPQVQPLVSPDGAKGRGGVRIALLPTHGEQMEWVGDRVVEVLAAGRAPADIAVLCRATSDFASVKKSLADRGVAVEVLGLDGMLTAPEVVEVLAVLQVLHDATANAAVVRLLAGPRWAVGPRDLALLGRRAAALAGGRGRPDADLDLPAALDAAVEGADPAELVSLVDALDDPGEDGFDPRALDRFAVLSAELRGLRRHVGEPLPDLVHRIVTTIGLDIELAASPEVRELHRAEGLAAFLDLVAGFADADGQSSLGAFLGWLQTARRYDAVPELDRPVAPGAVTLMTVHRAKGLEWPVVVLPSLTESVFPSSKGRARWTSRPEVVPYPLRGDADSLPRMGEWNAKGLAAFAEDCRQHDEREERRLAYVALTRAEHLVLACGAWWGPTQVKPRGPSAYLLTLLEHCRSGGGEVDQWAPEPEPLATNPVLGLTDTAAWPVVPDAAALARRRAAAEAVRAGRGLTLASLRTEPAQRTEPALPGLELEALGSDRAGGESLHGLTQEELAEVAGWDEDLELLLAELAVSRSGARSIPLPTSLSASDLVRLGADEEAFLRALARPMPAAPAAAAQRGSRFHAWVEEHYGRRALLGPDDLPGAADAGLDPDTDLAAMRAAFLSGPYAEQVPVDVEVPFALVLGGRLVQGRLDAVFATTGPDGEPAFEVVDWKTSRAQNADPLQLAIYRVAYADLAGVPLEQVSAVFCYVRDGSVVRPPDLPDRAALEALLRG